MKKLISLENVSKTFTTRDRSNAKITVKVLDGLNLDIYEGDVLCLIGPSGSGKSTCLRTINALETIDSGRIEVCGHIYDGKKPLHKIRQETAMVFQRFELFPHLTALQNVALGPRLVQKKSKAEAESMGEDLLKRVGLSNQAHKYPQQLSGGQQQRVSIARALAANPKVLLCDEPTSALDPELVHEVTDILQVLAREGMTMMIVTHEMRFARNVATECLFLEGGRIVERARPQAFFDQPQHARLKTFLETISH
ncbi:MAG: amino acid ABC transporter ATP-binding protein [Bdellovibrionota bacterium]|nr:MAG: amino acid ABC transporter ATP-binding protein [Pseudomonadota bacterium]